MISSLYRIVTIGRNTLTEAVRQKVLSVLLIFSLVLVGSSVLVSQLATPGLDSAGMFDAQIKFVKDFGCGAIGLFGFAIALLSTAQASGHFPCLLAAPAHLESEFPGAAVVPGKRSQVVLLFALAQEASSGARSQGQARRRRRR